MKKTLKSQLTVAIAMMIVAVVAISGATYAWFTIGTGTASVDNIQLYVQAAGALLIAPNKTDVVEAINSSDWKTTLAQSEIIAKQDDNPTGLESGVVLYNVSTLFNDTSSAFYKASALDATGKPTAADDAKEGEDYVKFSLWVRSDRAGTLQLAGNATATKFEDAKSYVIPMEGVKGAASTPINIFTGTPNGYLNGIAYTVRVGFVPLTMAEDGDNDDKMTAGAEIWDSAVIWEPKYNKNIKPVGSWGTALDTEFAISAKSTLDFEEQTPLRDFGTTTTTGSTSANDINLFDLAAGDAQKFNVYIWVEGADADTVNQVANRWFRTMLTFGIDVND